MLCLDKKANNILSDKNAVSPEFIGLITTSHICSISPSSQPDRIKTLRHRLLALLSKQLTCDRLTQEISAFNTAGKYSVDTLLAHQQDIHHNFHTFPHPDWVAPHQARNPAI